MLTCELHFISSGSKSRADGDTSRNHNSQNLLKCSVIIFLSGRIHNDASQNLMYSYAPDMYHI